MKTNPAVLARKVLEHYFFDTDEDLQPFAQEPLFEKKAGAFVTLKKGDKLRGCIGTAEPVRGNLFAEIKENAVAAALRDPRFTPVSAAELGSLNISVDVLSPMEKITGIDALDPKKYGVLVRSAQRSGLLLPDLEGVESAEEQVAIARLKAGITSEQPAELYRFTVTRYHE